MLGLWAAVFTLIVFPILRDLKYIFFRVWVPLSVPILYPRLNVDVNKCKQEPGSKIAQNSNLKTTQVQLVSVSVLLYFTVSPIDFYFSTLLSLYMFSCLSNSLLDISYLIVKFHANISMLLCM